MDIDTFLAQIAQLERRLAPGARNAIFCRRARQLIMDAYVKDGNKWQSRENADTGKADKLMALGFEQAIYGAGRNLLMK